MSKKIVVKCSDSVARTFEVEESVAHSHILKNMLEDDFSEVTIPDHISSEAVFLVIDYCRKRADAKEDEEQLKKCDKILADLYKAPNAKKPKSLIEMLKVSRPQLSDLIKFVLKKTCGINNLTFELKIFFFRFNIPI